MIKILIVSLIFCSSAFAQQKATASWDPVTKDVNGKTENVAGYKLYIGTSSGVYNFRDPVDVGNQTQVQVSELFEFDKRYYFAVTCYDLTGNESGYSDEQSQIWTKPDTDAPAKPTNFILILLPSGQTIKGKID